MNLLAWICVLLSTNATPVPDQCHKTSCILLLGDIFQLISKLQSNDLPLNEHQCNPIPLQYHKTSCIFTA